MIGLRTPTGDKNYTLKGIQTPDGPKNIARGSILTPDGDVIFHDTIAASLSVTTDRPSVYGAAASDFATTVTTNATSVLVSNGTAPFTYLWEEVSSDSPGWSIIAPGSSNQAFRFTGNFVGFQSAVFKVTVTDARGATGISIVDASVTNYGDLNAF